MKKTTKDPWASMKYCHIDGGYTDNQGNVQPGDWFEGYLCAIPQTKWQEDNAEHFPGDEKIFFYFDLDDRKKIRKAIKTGDYSKLGSDFLITKIVMDE